MERFKYNQFCVHSITDGRHFLLQIRVIGKVSFVLVLYLEMFPGMKT